MTAPAKEIRKPSVIAKDLGVVFPSPELVRKVESTKPDLDKYMGSGAAEMLMDPEYWFDMDGSADDVFMRYMKNKFIGGSSEDRRANLIALSGIPGDPKELAGDKGAMMEAANMLSAKFTEVMEVAVDAESEAQAARKAVRESAGWTDVQKFFKDRSHKGLEEAIVKQTAGGAALETKDTSTAPPEPMSSAETKGRLMLQYNERMRKEDEDRLKAIDTVLAQVEKAGGIERATSNPKFDADSFLAKVGEVFGGTADELAVGSAMGLGKGGDVTWNKDVVKKEEEKGSLHLVNQQITDFGAIVGKSLGVVNKLVDNMDSLGVKAKEYLKQGKIGDPAIVADGEKDVKGALATLHDMSSALSEASKALEGIKLPLQTFEDLAEAKKVLQAHVDDAAIKAIPTNVADLRKLLFPNEEFAHTMGNLLASMQFHETGFSNAKKFQEELPALLGKSDDMLGTVATSLESLYSKAKELASSGKLDTSSWKHNIDSVASGISRLRELRAAIAVSINDIKSLELGGTSFESMPRDKQKDVADVLDKAFDSLPHNAKDLIDVIFGQEKSTHNIGSLIVEVKAITDPTYQKPSKPPEIASKGDDEVKKLVEAFKPAATSFRHPSDYLDYKSSKNLEGSVYKFLESATAGKASVKTAGGGHQDVEERKEEFAAVYEFQAPWVQGNAKENIVPLYTELQRSLKRDEGGSHSARYVRKVLRYMEKKRSELAERLEHGMSKEKPTEKAAPVLTDPSEKRMTVKDTWKTLGVTTPSHVLDKIQKLNSAVDSAVANRTHNEPVTGWASSSEFRPTGEKKTTVDRVHRIVDTMVKHAFAKAFSVKDSDETKIKKFVPDPKWREYQDSRDNLMEFLHLFEQVAGEAAKNRHGFGAAATKAGATVDKLLEGGEWAEAKGKIAQGLGMISKARKDANSSFNKEWRSKLVSSKGDKAPEGVTAVLARLPSHLLSINYDDFSPGVKSLDSLLGQEPQSGSSEEPVAKMAAANEQEDLTNRLLLLKEGSRKDIRISSPSQKPLQASIVVGPRYSNPADFRGPYTSVSLSMPNDDVALLPTYMLGKFKASGSPVDIRPDAKPGMTYFYDVPTSMLSQVLDRYLSKEDKDAAAGVTRSEASPEAVAEEGAAAPAEAVDAPTKAFFSPESADSVAKSIYSKAERLLGQVRSGLALIREGRASIIERVIPHVESILSAPVEMVASTGATFYQGKNGGGTTYARKMFNMFNHLAGTSSDQPGKAIEGDAYFHSVMTNDSGYGGKFFADKPSQKHKEASVTVSAKQIDALAEIFKPMRERVDSAVALLARNKVLDTLEKHLNSGGIGPESLLEGMTGKHSLEQLRFLIKKLKDLSESEMPSVSKALDRRLASLLAIASGSRDDKASDTKALKEKAAPELVKEAGELLSYLEYIPGDRLLISSMIREIADTLQGTIVGRN